jgi:ubiquinone/menaquinone biosynthesis C-methylase UbiE/uncharacterized protein (UPF0335 family)
MSYDNCLGLDYCNPLFFHYTIGVRGEVMKRFEQFLNKGHNKRILDIGTGTGEFLGLIHHLYQDYDQMIGIDASSRMIDMANTRNQHDKISFQVMDASNLEFKDDSFDLVTLSNSLHHLDDIPGILSEMKRVVKKDGYILINEMISNKLDAMQESHKLLHHFAAKIDRLNGDTHRETYTDSEILSIVKDTGLQMDDFWYLEVERRKTNTKEELEHITNLINRVFERVPEENKNDLLEEKNRIEEYIKSNGYDGATSLLVVLKK